MSESSNLLNLLSFFITLYGLYFAYFQWNRLQKEKRFHLLKVLKVHLDCLGPWVGRPKGYGKELTTEEKFNSITPFNLIYNTASESLISLNLLDDITNVPKEIIGELNQLYYDLIRIQNVNQFRRDYVLADTKLSNSLYKKVTKYRSCETYLDLTLFYSRLNDDEKDLAERLLKYGHIIHCDVIGNKEWGARNHWEKLNEWVIEELKPQNDYIFLLITLFVIMLTSIGIDQFNITNIGYWIVILTILVFSGYVSGSLIRFKSILN